jgi:DNA-binding GntR family transcriptional regulator
VENGRGMTVIGISKDDMVDMYDARMRLEGEAARRAARVITDDQINELRELIDLQLYYIDKNATKYSEKIKNLDSQFHQLLYSCCGSKTYTDILVALHKKMTKFRIASVSVQSRALQSNREHQAICDALATHDEDLAENATLEHVAHARERMLSMETMD